MTKLRTAAGLFVKNRRRLWGIPHLYVSYAFFAVYAALVVAAILRLPLLAGVALAFAAVVEISDILPKSRRSRRLADWRRGLETRSRWRILLFIIALALSDFDLSRIALFAGLALVSSLIGSLMRSDRLYLHTTTLLRPLGSMQAGVGRLKRGRLLARRRDMAVLPLEVAVLFSGLVLTLPGLGFAAAVLISVIAVVAASVNAVVVAMACRRIRPGLILEHNDEVLAEFLEYDPEVICYFNGHPGTRFAVDVWIDTFEAMNRRVALIYRHSSTTSVDTDRLPGLVVRHEAMLANVVGPSTKIALYPANGTLNVHMQGDRRMSHVFIGHGDSDKAGSARPVAGSYDEVWVSGRAGMDRYAAAGVEIPDQRFVVVGRPPLSPRVRAHADRKRHERQGLDATNDSLSQVKQMFEDSDSTRPIVLYAPTWEGYFDNADYSSVMSMGADLMATLMEDNPELRLIYKPHPLTGHRIKALRSESRRIVEILEQADNGHVSASRFADLDIYHWFDLSDVLVCDVSSVISDYMAWDRPYVVTNPAAFTTSELISLFPTTESAYVIDAGTRSSSRVVANALTHDPLKEKRRRTREYYLGSSNDDPLDLINQAADDLYKTTMGKGG